MIQDDYSVETPEGIDLQAQLAGPAPRAMAFLIDISIRFGLYTVGSIAFSFFDGGFGFLLLLLFLLEWFYPVVFEVLMRGQTPGKQVMKITVVNEDLTPIGWNASIIRNLMRAVDMLPVCYFFGLVSTLMSQRFQRLGDFAAGTLVIHSGVTTKATDLPKAKALAPSSSLPLEDQSAIISFTQRHQQLTDGRREELADILYPLHSRQGNSAVQYLFGVGRWLLGDRG